MRKNSILSLSSVPMDPESEVEDDDDKEGDQQDDSVKIEGLKIESV